MEDSKQEDKDPTQEEHPESALAMDKPTDQNSSGEGITVLTATTPQNITDEADSSSSNNATAEAEISKDDAASKEEGSEDDGYKTEDETNAPEEEELLNNLLLGDMPLFHYTRLPVGTLPRLQPSRQQQEESPIMPFSHDCTCSIMGKVVWNAEARGGGAEGGGGGGSATTTGAAAPSYNEPPPLAASSSQRRPLSAHWWHPDGTSLPIVVMGFANGQLRMIDATTFLPMNSKPDQDLKIRDGGGTAAVTALSMDASGTFVGASDRDGMCTIFELKYKVEWVQPTTGQASSSTAHQSPTSAPTQGNMFSSFMSALTGASKPAIPAVATTSSQDEASNDATMLDGVGASSSGEPVLIPTLQIASVVQAYRVSYPRSFGQPTSLALDPAYKRRREKGFVCGFNDGRLCLTKKGFVFQRRNDVILYQSTDSDSKNSGGIHQVIWRGSLVAWTDATGVRLIDSDTWTRIAHVDRPVGARPSLYPTVQDLQASLCFETSEKLLVAWGDCLLQLRIREQGNSNAIVAQANPENNSTQDQQHGGPPAVVRRRTVECSMAWELDCVACGVVPLDHDNVVVLGLVPPAQHEGDDRVSETSPPVTQDSGLVNDVEIQVISRMDGNVVYSDILPLVRKPLPKKRNKFLPEPMNGFRLLSSFALPRMDDYTETLEEGGGYTDEDTDSLVQVPLFGGGQLKKPYQDAHLKWGLKLVTFDEETRNQSVKPESKENEDTDSVDSDDYGFVNRPLTTETAESSLSKAAVPPSILITSASDAVSARVRTVDDAVSSALAKGKPALALRRAIRHLPRLRRYQIDDLVNDYFAALLRMRQGGSSAASKRKLSLRRMKLVATAMPVLIGANVEMWQRWISTVEKIPGALLIVRTVIPVRDPVLPKHVYGGVLRNLLVEVEEMIQDPQVHERLAVEAENHFLNTLLGWGTTLTLREHIKLYSQQSASFAGGLEDALIRRDKQTSAIYMRFPAPNLSLRTDEDESSQSVSRTAIDDRNDSLFDVQELFEVVRSKRPRDSAEEATPLSNGVQSRVALDAMAKLCMMKGDFDGALSYYLSIGDRFPSETFQELESRALALVNTSPPLSLAPTRETTHAYVLDLIESKNLHFCLLDSTLLAEWTQTLPIFALMQLVGLELVGEFLTNHCVAPDESSRNKSPGPNDRRVTLPIDAIADQLESSPKILYWYLHMLFLKKPDIYVRFPTTANPPPSVTRLHRKALDLYIRFAGRNRDSALRMMDVETYKANEVSTPFLSFLKVVLHLGGITPAEVAKSLQAERRGSSANSGIFALELAYIMEHFGEENEEEARLILELYLKGARSLMLAVSFAQRAQPHTSTLWELLIDFCLSKDDTAKSKASSVDGSNFGSLLEAAALAGADLASLVAQIPHGMSVEGLRPRLVAAVADYRMKVQTYANATEVSSKEKIDLIRELAHRSRRGVRFDVKVPSAELQLRDEKDRSALNSVMQQKLFANPRPKRRQKKHYAAFSLPMR